MSNVGAANVRLSGDESGLIKSLDNARHKFSLFTREINSNVIQAYKRADQEQKAFRGGLTKLGDEIQGVGQKMMLFGSLPTLFAAGKSWKDYAELQRMEKGLSLYGESLADVRRLAKEPNIGVFDGAKALVGLRAVRIESDLAERAVKSFANAITGAGGNNADLEPALFNLKQFKATQNINQVDLRQLANRIPQTIEVLEKQFGTTDTAALNKLGIDKFIEGFVEGLEKLPKVQGLAISSTEQLSDSFTFFSGTIGKGIENAAGVSSALLTLGGILDNLATNFEALNPEAQSAILWIGGMAVAIPILTTAIGTLIKFLPITAAGFAGISWPVMVVIALTSAIGGLIALWPLLNNQMAKFQEQQDLVAGFAPKLDPLIAKYEDLKKNADPKEQKELQTVIKQIADMVPSAVTGWDKYGNAIDINKTKVTAYTEEQKKLLSAMQAVRREQLLTENRKSGHRKEELQNALLAGSETRQVNLGMGVYQTQTKKLVPEDLKKFSSELSAINEKEIANRKELLSLGGQDIYVKEFNRLKELKTEREKVSSEYKSALKSENQSLISSLNDRAVALDKDIVKQRAKVAPMVSEWNLAKAEARAGLGLGTGGKSTNKTATGSEKVDKAAETANHKKYLEILKEELRLRKEIQSITNDAKRLDLIGSNLDKDRTLATGVQRGKDKSDALADQRMPQTLDSIQRQFNANPSDDLRREMAAVDLMGYFKGNLKIDELRKHFAAIPRMLGETVDEYQLRINGFADATVKLKNHFGSKMGLQEMRDYFKEIPQMAKESAEAYEERKNRFVDATIQLNANMTSALRQAAGDVAVGFGEMLGDLINGTGGLEKFGQKIMGTMAALLKDFGKAMIGFGTAAIVLKNLGKNPYLAVAAGIALVALGQVAQNSMKNKAEGASVKLAKGGLAYGQTAAIIGDNPNVQFDPEVVAPLSKLQKIMGENKGSGGTQVFIPEMQLRGDDIWVQFNRVDQRNKALGIG